MPEPESTHFIPIDTGTRWLNYYKCRKCGQLGVISTRPPIETVPKTALCSCLCVMDWQHSQPVKLPGVSEPYPSDPPQEDLRTLQAHRDRLRNVLQEVLDAIKSGDSCEIIECMVPIANVLADTTPPH